MSNHKMNIFLMLDKACDLLSDEWKQDCDKCPYGNGDIFHEYCDDDSGCLCDDVKNIEKSIERLVKKK